MTFACRSPIRVGTLLLAALLCVSGSTLAQSKRAIPESTLREPWILQLAVLESLAPAVSAADADTRFRLDPMLAALESALAKYEERVDRVIDRIVGDPQLAYVAAQVSQELSVRLAEVHAGFQSVYGVLGVGERADVRAAQASLEALRKVLESERPFEEDVLQALGSGSRQQIVGLATRWWNGEERAIAVKKAVGALARAPTR